jgi:hypothetical protein
MIANTNTPLDFGRLEGQTASAVSTSLAGRTRNAPATAGFALIGVLIIVGLVATLSATYAHHVIAGAKSNLASPSQMQAQETCRSSLELARQAMLTGATVQSSVVDSKGATTTLSVTQTAADTRSISVLTSHPDGSGASTQVSAVMVPDPSDTPSGPDALPHLSGATISALLADSSVPRLHYTADTVVSGADLAGLLVVHDGVTLTLSDVVLAGAIVSEAAVTGGAIGAFDILSAPELVIAGNLRIDGLDALPSVAILMPDGALSTTSFDGTVQLVGDVIAHSVSLNMGGTLSGHVQAVMSSSLSSELDLIGSERKPLAWSTDLEFGDVWDASSLAVLPATSSIASLSAITDYWSNH